jgi:hypothetical protein
VVGMRTPWGKADSVEMVVPGVYVVSTPSHGGIKLDRFVNHLVPAGCRTKGGWYEEDCEVAIVFAVHRTTRQHFKIDEAQNALSLANWLPAQYVVLRDAGFIKPTAAAEARLVEALQRG